MTRPTASHAQDHLHQRAPVGAVTAGLLGLFLVGFAVFGLIAASAPSDGSAHDLPPTHRVDFDVRPQRDPTTTTTTAATTTEPAVPTTGAPTTTAPRPVPLPVSVRIPAIGVDSRLIPLGLNPDNTLQVPQDFGVAGWYTGRPVPGEIGPSVVVGHVDSKSGPAVFYRLEDLQPGAIIEVACSDGTVAKFSVVAKEQHDKDAFPTARVYDPTDSPELRLITCGGNFDRSIGHYNDNVVVFAVLTEIV